MKKFSFILLSSLLILGGCSKPSTPEPTPTPEQSITEDVQQEEIVGGWEERVNQEVTDELLEIFNNGVAGTQYEGLKPIKFLATQVVSGMNFKFLCDNGEEVIIYQDLNGVYSALNSDGTVAEKTILDQPSENVVQDEITEEQAKEIALNQANVSVDDAEFIRVEKDYDDGRHEWDVEFNVGTTEYSYTIDIMTGDVLESEKDKD